MSNVVRFPDRESDDDAPGSPPSDTEPIEIDVEIDEEAELYILNLYRSRSHHPAGSRLPQRRAE